MNSWFYNWSQLKDSGITSLHLDIDRNMIQVHEATSTLTLYPEGYVNPKKVEFPSQIIHIILSLMVQLGRLVKKMMYVMMPKLI